MSETGVALSTSWAALKYAILCSLAERFQSWALHLAPRGYLTSAVALVVEKEAEIQELRAALVHVRAIIVDASMTGFNCHDGDWADRLFSSQAMTRRALSHPKGTET